LKSKAKSQVGVEGGRKKDGGKKSGPERGLFRKKVKEGGKGNVGSAKKVHTRKK